MNDKIYIDIVNIINSYFHSNVRVFSAYTMYKDLKEKYDLKKVTQVLDQMSDNKSGHICAITVIHNPQDFTEKIIYDQKQDQEFLPQFVQFPFDQSIEVSPDMVTELYILKK